MLIAPPGESGSDVKAMLGRFDWIRYDRGTTSGAMAARYVRRLLPDKRSALELDGVTAIVAMVSAGLGVSVVQLMDPAVCERYPVKVIRLGAAAPQLQMSIVMHKGDEDRRALLAVCDAMRRVAQRLGRSSPPSGTPSSAL